MRILRPGALLLAIAMFLPLPARAAESGFAFLRVPLSARSVGMGESGVAFLDGADAFFVNPAGLASPTGDARSSANWKMAGDAALSHHEAFSIYRQDAAILNLARGREAFALQFQTFYSEGVDERDEVGNLLGTFGLVDLSVQLGFARTVSPGLRLGVAGGYVSERVADETAGTWVLSGGGTWSPTSMPKLRVGAAIRQLGGKPSFDVNGIEGTQVSLPVTLQGGAAYTTGLGKSGRLAFAGDVRKAADDDATFHAGAEAGWSVVDLRVGGRFGTDVGHFTAGAGVTAGHFTVDYAFLPSNEELGNSHRIELRSRFGL